MYKERDENKRLEFLGKIKDIPKDLLVFVDECGINEYLYSPYCYAMPGVKIVAEISGKIFQRTNIIAGYVNGKSIAPLVYSVNTTKALVEEWVDKVLVRELKAGQVVIWDNASFHKSEKAKKAVESAGCKLIFLPPYSPDLNPIEKFWANFKKYLQKIIATYSSLWDAILSFFQNPTNCNSFKRA